MYSVAVTRAMRSCARQRGFCAFARKASRESQFVWTDWGRVPMLPTELAIIHDTEYFRHPDAAKIFRWALGARGVKTVIIDLTHVRDATTAAFAQLVLLRRKLLRSGRDLRLMGLRERAARVYEVNRLAEVLPMREVREYVIRSQTSTSPVRAMT
jgi:anti-anti-sigma regulatory factor